MTKHGKVDIEYHGMPIRVWYEYDMTNGDFIVTGTTDIETGADLTEDMTQVQSEEIESKAFVEFNDVLVTQAEYSRD